MSMMLFKSWTFCIYIALAWCRETPLVNTDLGPVVGIIDNDIYNYYGIPYVEPPVGNLRWHSPVPKKPWTDVLHANQFGPGCPQECNVGPGVCPKVKNEDCLRLNVFAPINSTSDSNLDVMVYIHGGTYILGTSSVSIYYPSELVKNFNVVVVTGEYRLGVLGFMATKKLNGNFGIQDQREILKFVQRNIREFGGNPNNVTLFGESAGAGSAGIHLTSTKSNGLFHRVIMQSNPLGMHFLSKEEATDNADYLACQVGCTNSDDMKCLLSKSAGDLVSAAAKPNLKKFLDFDLRDLMTWQPVVDGDEITMQTMDAIEMGNYLRVPIMMGTDKDEGVLFVYNASYWLPNVVYHAAILLAFGWENFWTIAVDYYPPPTSPWEDCRHTLARVLNDYMFACPARKLLSMASRNTGNIPYHLYLFDHPLKSNSSKFPACQNMSCHGAELSYVFNSLPARAHFNEEEKKLAQDIGMYWTGFAHGDINYYGSKLPVQWPAFTFHNMSNIVLATPISTDTNYLEYYCAMWDKIGYDH